MTTLDNDTLSANAAASVTGVPLKQVHRIIDAGLLDSAARSCKGSRMVLRKSLVGLKLAYETADILTVEGRRRLVRHQLDHPGTRTAREDSVSVDLRTMKAEVRRGLSVLDKAMKIIATDKGVLGGAPCFKGTRIPIHDIADMIANGDSASAIRRAYPVLTDARIAAAVLYAQAYPRRGRPRRTAVWRRRKLLSSSDIPLDELPQVS